MQQITHAEKWFQLSCFATLLKLHFGMGNRETENISTIVVIQIDTSTWKNGVIFNCITLILAFPITVKLLLKRELFYS